MIHITRAIKNIYYDIKMGGKILSGGVDSRFKDAGANMTSNSQYDELDEIFSKITVNFDDIFVDVGCGKGRVLNYWCHKYPHNKVYGVEIDPEISALTAKRLKKFDNCTVISGSVLAKFPEDGTIFYLFNPFDEKILREFSATIKRAAQNGKCRTIIYVNCMHLNVFDEDSFEIRKLDGLLHEVAIITVGM